MERQKNPYPFGDDSTTNKKPRLEAPAKSEGIFHSVTPTSSIFPFENSSAASQRPLFPTWASAGLLPTNNLSDTGSPTNLFALQPTPTSKRSSFLAALAALANDKIQTAGKNARPPPSTACGVSGSAAQPSPTNPDNAPVPNGLTQPTPEHDKADHSGYGSPSELITIVEEEEDEDADDQEQGGDDAGQEQVVDDVVDNEEQADAVTKKEGEPPTNSQAIKHRPYSANTAESARHNTKPTARPIPTDVFDSRGDLILIVGPTQRPFRVCSRSLARSSPVWEKMLYGPFAEGKDQQSTDDWTITLPEDDPAALQVFLQAVHCRVDAIPSVLSPDALFKLTLLCDKYDTVGLLKSHWHDWVKKLGWSDRTPLGFVRRLWIAHTLGYLHYYKTTLAELLTVCRTVKGKPGVFVEGVSKQDLCENTYLQALGIADHLKDGRLALIREIATRIKQAIEGLTNRQGQAPLCRSQGGHADWPHICDCAMLGALHRTLYKKAWYSSGSDGWVDSITLNPRHLIVEAEEVRVSTIAESRIASRKGGHHHQDCTPWTPIKLAGILVFFRIEEHVRTDTGRFRKQQAKSGVPWNCYESLEFFDINPEYGL